MLKIALAVVMTPSVVNRHVYHTQEGGFVMRINKPKTKGKTTFQALYINKS